MECVYMSTFGLSFVKRFVFFSECPLSEVSLHVARSVAGNLWLV